ncbi:MAG: membrane protein insertion efficiency factor YidD [Clostridia bacterium]|nr:membrane protein insertion efficiency factor YidD [Clostridia bacterium]
MKQFFLKAVRFYRAKISPTKPPCCRFTPTCSQYALTAIERFGAWKGFWMTLWRVLRCNPLCKGGYDPVPEKPTTIPKEEDSL